MDEEIKNFLKVGDTKTSDDYNNLEISNYEKTNVYFSFFSDESKIKESLRTKFFKACERGENEKILSMLHKKYHMDRKPNINEKYLYDFTVLHISITNRHSETVKLLLDQGADIESETTMKRRPLHLAVIIGDFELTDYLISCGADLNCLDIDNRTPLHYASRMGYKKIVELLVFQKTIINVKNIYGETALDIVCNAEILEVRAK